MSKLLLPTFLLSLALGTAALAQTAAPALTDLPPDATSAPMPTTAAPTAVPAIPALPSLTPTTPAAVPAASVAVPALPAIPGMPSLTPLAAPVAAPVAQSKATTAAPKTAAPVVATSAKATVENFYRAYLKPPTKAGEPVATIAKSKAFQDAITENKRVCKEYADGNVCGWGSDNDVYINSQERDPKLTYQNSGITITEVDPKHIEVVLNVYPSQIRNVAYYKRHIFYTMIEENGQWVVDDMRDDIGGMYARAQMEEENTKLMPVANPRYGR